MNCYYNGEIVVAKNLKLLLLLEIVCWNYYYWRLFIGAFVARMEELLLKLLFLKLMLM